MLSKYGKWSSQVKDVGLRYCPYRNYLFCHQVSKSLLPIEKIEQQNWRTWNSEYQMCSAVLWLLAWLLLYSCLLSFTSNAKYLQRCQTYFSRPTHTWGWLWENRNLTMKTITNLTPSTQSLEGETRSKLLSTQRLTRVRVFHNVTTLTQDK